MQGDTYQVAKQRVLVLSPHLDDAAISAWHVLASSDDVQVVTVFAGIPEGGFVTPLDRLNGATESAERVREQRADDQAALATLGRQPIHLDMLDAQYRAHRIPELREAIEKRPFSFMSLTGNEDRLRVEYKELSPMLSCYVDENSVTYAPVGIGANPDHRSLARFGAELARNGHAVRFYADYPYALRYGAPSWTAGRANPQADAYIGAELVALFPGTRLDREVVRLDHHAVVRKLETIRRYRTEFDLLMKAYGGALGQTANLQYEVYWYPTRQPLSGPGRPRPYPRDWRDSDSVPPRA